MQPFGLKGEVIALGMTVFNAKIQTPKSPAVYTQQPVLRNNVIRNLSKLGVMGQSSGQTESGVDPVWWTVAEWGK